MKVPEPGARRDSSGCIAGALNPFSKASVISSGRRKSGRQEKDETETARMVRKHADVWRRYPEQTYTAWEHARVARHKELFP